MRDALVGGVNADYSFHGRELDRREWSLCEEKKVLARENGNYESFPDLSAVPLCHRTERRTSGKNVDVMTWRRSYSLSPIRISHVARIIAIIYRLRAILQIPHTDPTI